MSGMVAICSFSFPLKINLKKQPTTPKIKMKINNFVGISSLNPNAGSDAVRINKMLTNLIHLLEGFIPFDSMIFINSVFACQKTTNKKRLNIQPPKKRARYDIEKTTHPIINLDNCSFMNLSLQVLKSRGQEDRIKMRYHYYYET